MPWDNLCPTLNAKKSSMSGAVFDELSPLIRCFEGRKIYLPSLETGSHHNRPLKEPMALSGGRNASISTTQRFWLG